MPHLSTSQLLLIAGIAVLFIIPSAIILRRMGYSGWWGLIAPISPLNLIGLWILAYAHWPRASRFSS